VEPKPNLVENYPKDGELHHLFRKRLTKKNLCVGLIC
jgi:hypothetical protein